MLFPIIVSPEVFSASSNSCNSRTALLKKLFENCIIIVDDNKALMKEIQAEIEKWPVNFRKPAKEILRQMRQKNRIVATRKKYEIHEECQYQNCQYCVGICKADMINTIITTQSCCQCLKSQASGIRKDNIINADDDFSLHFSPSTLRMDLGPML
jgi:hypothetical protein